MPLKGCLWCLYPWCFPPWNSWRIPSWYIWTIIFKRKNLRLLILEIFQWIGIYIFMFNVYGFSHFDFWSNQPIETFRGAPYRFHEWMYYHRFKAISKKIAYTDRNPPAHKDRLLEVHQLINMWKNITKEIFNIPGVGFLV